jgi:hypothetical protein
VSYDPKEEVFYALRFASFNRERYVSDKETFRECYRDLIKSLSAGLWIERILREKVLLWDTPSVADRLLGAQLAEHLRNRAATEISHSATRDLVVDQQAILTDIEFDCHYCGWPWPAIGELSGPARENEEDITYPSQFSLHLPDLPSSS